MPKQKKHVSDILRDVCKRSALARNIPSVAIARFWKSQGVELTDEQLIQIQLLDKQFKPQTILREWSRQRQSVLAGIKNPVYGHDVEPPKNSFLNETPAPRKKFLGLF